MGDLIFKEPFLIINTFVLLVSLVIVVQRVHSLWFKFGMSSEDMLKQVFGFVESGSFARALQLCNAKDHPISSVFKAALTRANRTEREIRRSIEIAALTEMPRLKKGTGYMPQLSNVATLFGLIGTIRGLIISFSGVAAGNAAEKQAMLSEGIAIAFWNTFYGLTIAVVVIIAYMMILGRQTKLVGQIELGAARLVDQLLIQQSLGREKAKKSG